MLDPLYYLCSKPGSLEASRIDARRLGGLPGLPGLAWLAWLAGLAGLVEGWEGISHARRSRRSADYGLLTLVQRPFIKFVIKFNQKYVKMNGKDHPVTSYIPHFGPGTYFLDYSYIFKK